MLLEITVNLMAYGELQTTIYHFVDAGTQCPEVFAPRTVTLMGESFFVVLMLTTFI